MTNTTLFTNFIKVFTFAVCFCMFKTSYITPISRHQKSTSFNRKLPVVQMWYKFGVETVIYCHTGSHTQKKKSCVNNSSSIIYMSMYDLLHLEVTTPESS